MPFHLQIMLIVVTTRAAPPEPNTQRKVSAASKRRSALRLFSWRWPIASCFVQNCSVMALGLAYAGTAKPSVKEALSPLIDSEEPLERAAHASLALGLIYAGTSDGALCQCSNCSRCSMLCSTWLRAFAGFAIASRAVL